MSKILAVVAATLLAAGSAVALRLAQDEPKAVLSLDRLAWLAGSWDSGTEGRWFEEHWMRPAGGTMIGMGRLVSGSRTEFFEYLRLEEREGKVVYTAQIGGRPGVPFTLTGITEEGAVFENPDHDFPKRIVYRLEDDGSLYARIDAGKGEGGRVEEFRMKRRAEAPERKLGG